MKVSGEGEGEEFMWCLSRFQTLFDLRTLVLLVSCLPYEHIVRCFNSDLYFNICQQN